MTTGTVQEKGAEALGVKRCELPPEGSEQIEENRGVIPECRCGDAPVSVHPVLEVDQEGGSADIEVVAGAEASPSACTKARQCCAPSERTVGWPEG